MPQTTKARIGLIGLGTMGANLALNIAEKGFKVAVFNRTAEKTRTFFAGAGALQSHIVPCDTLADLVAAIEPPRAIILMVTAGAGVDDQTAALRPYLTSEDIVIDAGNANFLDTNRRVAAATKEGWPFLGIGVSGGEEGARHGPSVMAGGPLAAWQRVQPVFEAISAKYDGEACAARLGDAGAGHFVKTVHNGIEYADMQMIAEVYGVMRDGLGMGAAAIGEVFAGWNKGILNSYLVEISAHVSGATDRSTGQRMLDMILDRAGQKGTGRWTVIEAQHLGAPVTAIEAAVAARNMSAQLAARLKGAEMFGKHDHPRLGITPDVLEKALIAGKIICYAQGFALITAAAKEQGWTLDLPTIARIWREGCIIRSAMLNDMATALAAAPEANLMHSEPFLGLLRETQGSLRQIVAIAAMNGMPMPALSAALSYFDTMRQARGTANMIQAQRDFFGAHGFERTDKAGDGYHGPWGSGLKTN